VAFEGERGDIREKWAEKEGVREVGRGDRRGEGEQGYKLGKCSLGRVGRWSLAMYKRRVGRAFVSSWVKECNYEAKEERVHVEN